MDAAVQQSVQQTMAAENAPPRARDILQTGGALVQAKSTGMRKPISEWFIEWHALVAVAIAGVAQVVNADPMAVAMVVSVHMMVQLRNVAWKNRATILLGHTIPSTLMHGTATVRDNNGALRTFKLVEWMTLIIGTAPSAAVAERMGLIYNHVSKYVGQFFAPAVTGVTIETKLAILQLLDWEKGRFDAAYVVYLGQNMGAGPYRYASDRAAEITKARREKAEMFGPNGDLIDWWRLLATIDLPLSAAEIAHNQHDEIWSALGYHANVPAGDVDPYLRVCYRMVLYKMLDEPIPAAYAHITIQDLEAFLRAEGQALKARGVHMSDPGDGQAGLAARPKP
jgi:hypothetical protein